MLCTPCRRSKSRTVRFAFPFVIAAVLAGAAIIADERSHISIETHPATVREGELFFIDIKAVANTPVNAVDIVLSYPESQIEVVGIETGDSVITLWAEEPYAKKGSVYLRGGTFGQGFIGEHVIAEVRARATESGTAYVTANSVRFVAGDGSGEDVELDGDELQETKIYIANEDGSLVGEASVNIITDINGDGTVDLSDISAFMSAWFNNESTFDFNGDGRMTFRDFSILLADSFFN